MVLVLVQMVAETETPVAQQPTVALVVVPLGKAPLATAVLVSALLSIGYKE
jgi:hypothetical protein